METKEQIIKEIKELKEKRNAVILVHNYQRPEIYEIADFIGDSLELSRKAAETNKDVIVFCGVKFMAETAKILNPNKTVLLPAEDAGCPMAEMINARQLKEFKKQHPKASVVCYVNTNAETKAECDICCTSANVVEIVNSLKEEEAIMAPDKNLAAYAQTQTKKRLIPWNGYCPIHQEISEKSAVIAKKQNPGAIFIAHPECPQEVLKHADYIFSTGKMLEFAKENSNKTIILATEKDMTNRLAKENSKNKYLTIGGICPDMKKTTLEKVKEALEKNQYEIKVPEDVRKKAENSLRKMIAPGVIMENKIKKPDLKEATLLIKAAIKEDFNGKDVTSNLFKKDNTIINADLVTREKIVVCGTEVAREVLKSYDPRLKIKIYKKDGESADVGERIATITGPLCSILSAERVVLNFMQRLSGISTLTRKYVEAVKGTQAKIYDTRKTTPGWRALEKYAVRCGGGCNHRLGLYDAVLIKDNHLAQLKKNTYKQLEGIIQAAKKQKEIKFIEVEVDNLEQYKRILNIEGIDIILLDNMPPSQLKEAVALRGSKKTPLLEASGGIKFENLAEVAKTRVERIAVGAITHSAKVVDIGLDRNIIRTDCSVIGGGMAGCTVALELADSGKKVDLFVKRKLIEDCNSYLTAGGLTAVPLKNNLPIKGDSFESHIKDTLEAGKGLNDKEVVRFCSKNFYPEVIEWLVKKGVSFDKAADSKGFEYDLHREGGHSVNRIFHSKDTTGVEIMNVLGRLVKKHPNITLHEYHMAIDIVTKNKIENKKGEDSCIGFYAYDIKNDYVKNVSCPGIFVATGGLGKVFMYTSNNDIATGDGFAMCHRIGLPLANMEFIQFHPTVFYDPKAVDEPQRRFLLTEALRGAGAIIKSDKDSNEDCILKYSEMGSKATRDVVTRAEDLVMKEKGLKHLWLDCTKIPEEQMKKDFKNSYEFCMSKGINPTKEPIPVVYAVHYSNGGVLVGKNSETKIKGLYVIGEASYTGLHGATRLASNSAPECILFGKLAARHFISVKNESQGIPLWDLGRAVQIKDKDLIDSYWEAIRITMTELCGIARDEKRLLLAKSKIDSLKKKINDFYWSYFICKDFLEVRNIAEVAGIIIESALARKESRACHFRQDYPKENKDFLGWTIVEKDKKPTINPIGR